MIEVYATKQAEKYRLLIHGHAADTEEGRRVCAAVSALGGALLQYAKGTGGATHVRHVMEPGFLFLSCVGGVSGAFEAVVEALASIAKEYGEHVAPVTYSCR